VVTKITLIENFANSPISPFFNPSLIQFTSRHIKKTINEITAEAIGAMTSKSFTIDSFFELNSAINSMQIKMIMESEIQILFHKEMFFRVPNIFRNS
jgi:hypothetical protein